MMFSQSRKPSGGSPCVLRPFEQHQCRQSGLCWRTCGQLLKISVNFLAGALSIYSSAAGAEEVCLACMTESDKSSSSTMGLECRLRRLSMSYQPIFRLDRL